jgi:uncharacterized protein YeaO (DUF488 family)
MIRLKRAYAQPTNEDGSRVLVERLWPRGLRKNDAKLDAWIKDVAPSDELRRWFGHDPRRFGEFQRRYKHELRSGSARAAFDELARLAARRTVTLVYAAHDEVHNNAVVLAREIERTRGRVRARSRTRAGSHASSSQRAPGHRTPAERDRGIA